MLEAKKNQGEKIATEEKKLIMKLSPIYAERLAESKQQGIQQEANVLIIRLLKRKLGEIPLNRLFAKVY